jgi:hypothetical protein
LGRGKGRKCNRRKERHAIRRRERRGSTKSSKILVNVVPAGRVRNEWRTIDKTKSRKRGRRSTRPKAAEEIGGTSLAFFKPTDSSTQRRTRRFQRETIVQLTAERENICSGLSIPDVTSCTAISRRQLALNPTADRLALTRGDKGEILSVRAKNNFGSVPKGRRSVRREAVDG